MRRDEDAYARGGTSSATASASSEKWPITRSGPKPVHRRVGVAEGDRYHWNAGGLGRIDVGAGIPDHHRALGVAAGLGDRQGDVARIGLAVGECRAPADRGEAPADAELVRAGRRRGARPCWCTRRAGSPRPRAGPAPRPRRDRGASGRTGARRNAPGSRRTAPRAARASAPCRRPRSRGGSVPWRRRRSGPAPPRAAVPASPRAPAARSACRSGRPRSRPGCRRGRNTAIFGKVDIAGFRWAGMAPSLAARGGRGKFPAPSGAQTAPDAPDLPETPMKGEGVTPWDRP